MVLWTVILTTSCQYSDAFKRIETDHFIVEMPSYLSKVRDLHPHAQVQGRNNYRDVYFLVVEHEKTNTDSTFNASLDTITKGIQSYCRDAFLEKDSAFTVNGLHVQYRRVTGSIKDKRLVFAVALVKGKNYNYEITGWLFNSKRELWLKDIHQGMQSFREK
jgi:hypothetical protein